MIFPLQNYNEHSEDHSRMSTTFEITNYPSNYVHSFRIRIDTSALAKFRMYRIIEIKQPLKPTNYHWNSSKPTTHSYLSVNVPENLDTRMYTNAPIHTHIFIR
jgi:hypothetical protein